MGTLLNDLKKEAQAVASLLASYRSIIGDDEELKEATIEGETSLYEAMQLCHDRIVECEIMITGLEDKIEIFKARKESFKTKIESIRMGMLRALEDAELKKVELPTATIHTSKGVPSIASIDETLLPSKYWKRAEPKIDRDALLSDLKKGPVDGATLNNVPTILKIKAK